ncbi:MAG: phosphoribosylformylglycinamidine synthase subunit PurS, partial [Nitrospirae bacterium]
MLQPESLHAPHPRYLQAGVRHIRQSPHAPQAGQRMKAKVSVTLKRGILDPQGQAVLHA